MQNRKPTEAGVLQRMNDPAFRLHGENMDTATLEDAQKWAGTYAKLVNFKRELLDLCQKYAEQPGPDVARAIRETDMVLLEVELSRFQQRRDFWKLRASELAGNRRRGGRS